MAGTTESSRVVICRHMTHTAPSRRRYVLSTGRLPFANEVGTIDGVLCKEIRSQPFREVTASPRTACALEGTRRARIFSLRSPLLRSVPVVSTENDILTAAPELDGGAGPDGGGAPDGSGGGGADAAAATASKAAEKARRSEPSRHEMAVTSESVRETSFHDRHAISSPPGAAQARCQAAHARRGAARQGRPRRLGRALAQGATQSTARHRPPRATPRTARRPHVTAHHAPRSDVPRARPGGRRASRRRWRAVRRGLLS